MIPTNEQIEQVSIGPLFYAGATWMKEQMLGGVSESWQKWAINNFNIAPDLVEEFRFEFTCNLDQTLKAYEACALYYEKRLAEKDEELIVKQTQYDELARKGSGV